MNYRLVFTSLSLCFLFSFFSDISAMDDLKKQVVVSLTTYGVLRLGEHVLGKVYSSKEKGLVDRIKGCKSEIEKFDFTGQIENLKIKANTNHKFYVSQLKRSTNYLDMFNDLDNRVSSAEDSFDDFEFRIKKIEKYINRRKKRRKKRKKQKINQEEDEESEEEEETDDSSMRRIKTFRDPSLTSNTLNTLKQEIDVDSGSGSKE